VPQFSFLRDASQLGLHHIFHRDYELPGIDFRVKEQLAFLEETCVKYKAEYDSFPQNQVRPDEYGVHPNGGSYAPVDAGVMHCMVRHHKPKRVIEIGSGSSSLVMTAALIANAKEGAPSQLTCIDPHPDAARVNGLESLQSSGTLPIKFMWERKIVQKIDMSLFMSLEPGDILFIDSSHVARVGHDVNFLYLEVLPKVPKGVLVHVHDIFFPREYPLIWVMSLKRFLNEQYLLQMFLTGNTDWGVSYTGFLLASRFPTRMRRFFKWYGAVPEITGNPPGVDWQAAAFWMVRREKTDHVLSLSTQVAAEVDK
jgi:predicted O-methyltransferase YrrM